MRVSTSISLWVVSATAAGGGMRMYRRGLFRGSQSEVPILRPMLDLHSPRKGRVYPYVSYGFAAEFHGGQQRNCTECSRRQRGIVELRARTNFSIWNLRSGCHKTILRAVSKNNSLGMQGGVGVGGNVVAFSVQFPLLSP